MLNQHAKMLKLCDNKHFHKIDSYHTLFDCVCVITQNIYKTSTSFVHIDK